MNAYVVWVVEDEAGNVLALVPDDRGRPSPTYLRCPRAHHVRRHEPLGAERRALARLLGG